MPSNKKIPDRWTDYSTVGKRIPGSRFIAFKVPLKQSLRNYLNQSEAFGPLDLLHVLEKEGQELGLIIDLTFTTRYYKPHDLPDTWHYVKIFTAGHDVPSDSTILSFKKAVRKFLHENQNNDKLIGVHCTHGLNRTGYLVCRYLIDVDGVEPHKAIDLFNSSRGHTIERQNYLDDLISGLKRSNEGMDDPDQEPVQDGLGDRWSSPGEWRPNSSDTHHTYSWRGHHHQDQMMPFQQSAVNHQMRFRPQGPPGHLGPPGPPGPPGLLGWLPRPPPPHRWMDQGFRPGHFSTTPPYPASLPRYAPVLPPLDQEVPQKPDRKPRHRYRKSRRGQPR